MTNMDIVLTLYVVGIVLGIILAICWTILPFAIIGTKPLLRELIRETRRTNELLAQLGPLGARSSPGGGRIEPR